MALPWMLRRWLTDTVLHAAYLSQDAYGAPTYADPVTRPARVQFITERFTNHQGQERTSQAKVFLDGDVVVDLRDKFTLSDGTSPVVQKRYPVKDQYGGTHHIELMF